VGNGTMTIRRASVPRAASAKPAPWLPASPKGEPKVTSGRERAVNVVIALLSVTGLVACIVAATVRSRWRTLWPRAL
jgi:hypothetical protein